MLLMRPRGAVSLEPLVDLWLGLELLIAGFVGISSCISAAVCLVLAFWRF